MATVREEKLRCKIRLQRPAPARIATAAAVYRLTEKLGLG